MAWADQPLAGCPPRQFGHDAASDASGFAAGRTVSRTAPQRWVSTLQQAIAALAELRGVATQAPSSDRVQRAPVSH